VILDDDRGINPKEQLMSSCVHSILPNTSLASVHPGSSSPRWTAKVGMLEAALLETNYARVWEVRTGKALTGGPFLQVSYNFIGSQQGYHQFFARAYWELFDRLGLYYQPNYNIADGRMLSTEYGLRLKSKCDCWDFDVGVVNSNNPSEVQVQVMLTLGGLGSVGHNPFGRNPFQPHAGAGIIQPY